MRAGFLPPVSGQFRNKWRDSNSAWTRSEIWACVAPGCPVWRGNRAQTSFGTSRVLSGRTY